VTKVVADCVYDRFPFMENVTLFRAFYEFMDTKVKWFKYRHWQVPVSVFIS
jgi:hypothetical protein